MSKPLLLSIGNGKVQELVSDTEGYVPVWNDSLKEWQAAPSPGGGGGGVTSVTLNTGTTGLLVDTDQTSQTINSTGTFALSGTLNVVNGGTGLTTVTTAGNLLYVSDPNVISEGTLSNLDWAAVVAPGAIDLKASSGEYVALSGGAGANLGVDSGGELQIQGGDGASGGSVLIYGGYSYGTEQAGAGTVEIYGGDVVDVANIDSAPGNVIIQSGNQSVVGTTVRSGDVFIDTGYSAAGGGDINIGKDLANSVTIGRSGKTVAIGGSLTIGTALGAAYGGTGLGAPAAGDVGKVLAATSSGTYTLVPQSGGGGGTVTSVATGAGLTGGPITTTGTISLATTGTAKTDQGSASKTVTISTDAYGRVSSLSEQNISSLNADVITSGSLAVANGGTGRDYSSNTGVVTLLDGVFQNARALANGDISDTAGIVRSKLASGSAFRVLVNDASGYATELSSTGTAGQVLVSNGPGSLPTWGSGGGGSGSVSSVDVSGGTTGLTFSGGPITSSGTITMAGTLSLANGGTNANLTATQGGVVYGTGSELAVTSAGSAGQYLKSNGTSAPTWGDIATSSYDLRGAFIGNPSSNLVVDRFVSARAFTVSTTIANHKFYCVTPPATGQTVVVTVKKTPVSGSGAVTVFTATFRDAATNPVAGNGLYPASISAVSNGSVAETDLITVEVGTTNAAFQTFSWTIFATA